MGPIATQQLIPPNSNILPSQAIHNLSATTEGSHTAIHALSERPNLTHYPTFFFEIHTQAIEPVYRRDPSLAACTRSDFPTAIYETTANVHDPNLQSSFPWCRRAFSSRARSYMRSCPSVHRRSVIKYFRVACKQ